MNARKGYGLPHSALPARAHDVRAGKPVIPERFLPSPGANLKGLGGFGIRVQGW